MKESEFFQKLKTGVRQSFHLNDSERSQMREFLLSQVKPSPYTISTHKRSIFSYFRSFETAVHLTIITVFIVAGTSVGLVAAAETSLPGQLLYPIKISINEEFRGWIRSTPEQKIDWEIERTRRRLNEAAALAVQGKLNEDISLELTNNIEKHIDRANHDAQKLSQSNAGIELSTSSKLESSLKAHSVVLNAIADAGNKDESLGKIVTLADNQAEKAARNQIAAVEKIVLASNINETETLKSSKTQIQSIVEKELNETSKIIAKTGEMIRGIKVSENPLENVNSKIQVDTIITDTLIDSIDDTSPNTAIEKQAVDEISLDADIFGKVEDIINSTGVESNSTELDVVEKTIEEPTTLSVDKETSSGKNVDNTLTIQSEHNSLVLELEEIQSLINNGEYRQALERLIILRSDAEELLLIIKLKSEIEGSNIVNLENIQANLSRFQKRRLKDPIVVEPNDADVEKSDSVVEPVETSNKPQQNIEDGDSELNSEHSLRDSSTLN